MAMDVFDAEGRPLRARSASSSAKPWPGMARTFWRDPERYLDAYWRTCRGVWLHGDWASVDEDGYWFLHGRSDDTLNIAGKRIGPAEYESALVDAPGRGRGRRRRRPARAEGRGGLVLRVLAPGVEPANELRRRLWQRCIASLGRAFAFRPRCASSSPAEDPQRQDRAARRARGGARQDPGDLSTLENPEALEEIERAVDVFASES